MTGVRRGIALALAALVVAVGVTGCSASPRQTAVETGTAKAEGLTPLERGKVRREAVAAARAAVDAWTRGDLKAMAPLFTAAQVDYYRSLADKNTAAGLVRVRVHEQTSLDAVEMDATGQQVVVRYAFLNRSYTKNRSGAVVSAAIDKPAEVEITLRKTDGAWVVQQMFAGKETLE